MKRIFLVVILIILFSNVSLADERVSLGFIYATSNETELVTRTNGAINQVSPMYFDLTNKGNLVLSSSLDVDFVLSMQERGIKVIPVLSNHWNRSKGRAALKNAESLASQIIEKIGQYGFDGVNVDIENLTVLDKDDLTWFMYILKNKLPEDKELIVSVAANPNALEKGWQAVYDYEKLGEIVDYLFVMTYDEHSSGGLVGPVASYGFVENSIKYALKYVSEDKIVMGIPLYGRFWNNDESYGGEAVVMADVPRIVKKYNAVVTYDERFEAVEAKFTINESTGTTKINGSELSFGDYTIWYENDRSIKEKLGLVNKYNLLGAGVWALGQESTSIWEFYKDELNRSIYEAQAERMENYKKLQAEAETMKSTLNEELKDMIAKGMQSNNIVHKNHASTLISGAIVEKNYKLITAQRVYSKINV